MTHASNHLVDPELRRLLESFPDFSMTRESLPEMRKGIRFAREDPAPPEGVETRSHSVPGPDGAPDVAFLCYRPKGSTGTLPCIFHIHGGGYVMGAAANLAPAHMALVDQLGCMLVSVDYRLAPETIFPGAVEDCYAVLAWLTANGESFGVDAERIVVMGESAGGGLAAALALLARDRGVIRLAGQHLIYPMLDDRTCVAKDPNPYTGGYVWTHERNSFGWEALLGEAPGDTDVSHYAAAARAQDLSGLPPTFISTAALDLLVDENIEYARRLILAGVPTELHVYPGAFHGFDMDPVAKVSVAARRESIAALRKALELPED